MESSKFPMFASLEEVNHARELFESPYSEDDGPFIHVLDGFYPDAMAIRIRALEAEFVQYFPPTANQVSDEDFAEFSHLKPSWFSTSLLRYRGKDVNHPIAGWRDSPIEVLKRIEEVIGERINVNSWETGGDGWNGAFHLQKRNWSEDTSSIHHHFKPGDIATSGWSGIVYLTPNAPRECGTSIWADRSTGKCTAEFGAKFDYNPLNFLLVYRAENVFNRLVLFRENVLHRAGAGFGDEAIEARLTQTFFFETDRESS